MARQPISITYSATDNWAQHLSVAIASVIENNPGESLSFNVQHCDMTPDTCAKIAELANGRPQVQIAFHRIDVSRFKDCPTPKCISEIPFVAYFRLALPDILENESRTIYSDVDVLTVRGGIRELWEADLGEHSIACVSDHHVDSEDFRVFRRMLGLAPDDDYFCTGIMVMDLDRMRREGATSRLLAAAKRLRDIIVYVDQDVVNSVYAGKILAIPDKWNCANNWSPFRRDVVQWHFQCQTNKPWCNIWKCTTWLPYLWYLLKTPYRGNAFRFVWEHVKGFFWFSYTKNCMRRYLVCGIRVWKRKV